jgi:hypothetical protein
MWDLSWKINKRKKGRDRGSTVKALTWQKWGTEFNPSTVQKLFLKTILFNYLFGIRDWIQDLVLARKVLYHLSQGPYFLNRVLRFCLGQHGPPSPIYPSHIAGMTGKCCHIWLIGWEGVSLTFCLGWSRTPILLICTSWVAGITDVSHHTWPENCLT